MENKLKNNKDKEKNKKKEDIETNKLSKKIIIMAVLIIVLMIGLDQIIKTVVVNNFVEPVGFYLIKINYALNTGIAFGLNEGNNRNIVVTFIILILILNFVINQKDRIDRKTGISLCMITAGGISNLIDRFVYKGVVDYIDMIGFPIFNLADVYIVVGWILLVVSVISYSTKKE